MPPVVASRPSQKIAVVPLVQDYVLIANGTGYADIELDVPDFLNWGPYIEAVTIHQKTANFAAAGAYNWNVGLSSSFDGKTWSSPVDLLSTGILGAGSTVGAEYTTATSFGQYLKMVLRVKTTPAAADRATVSAVAVFRFRT